MTPFEVTYPGAAPVTLYAADPTDHIQACWAAGRFYECQRGGLLPYVAEHYTGGTFIDIGACVGNHSVFFAHVCGADYVLAVEPHRPAFDLLERNTADLPVTACFTACSDRWGLARMEPYYDGNLGMVRIAETVAPVPEGPGYDGWVPMWPLDSIMERESWQEITFVKVDVEHSEMAVLRGARETLETFRPAVSVECETPRELEAVDAFLYGLGYRRIDRVFNHTPTYIWEHPG